MIIENGKAVLKDDQGALKLVAEDQAEAALARLGLMPATADDIAADDKRKAAAAKPFVQKAGEAVEAAGNVSLRALEAASELLPGGGGMADVNKRVADTWSPSDERARQIAEEHPIATVGGQILSEVPAGLVGGIPGAALRVGQAALQGSAEESFVEGTGYEPKLGDALFYGGLQGVFELAVPGARKLKSLLPQRSVVEEGVERGKRGLGDVFADPDPIARADALADHADDVANVLDGQAELNSKYLKRETRKFLDDYFGKNMARDRRRDSLGYFSGKVSDEAAGYAEDLKTEWLDAVRSATADDPSDWVRAWALEQESLVSKLPNDPRAVHRAMLEGQLESPLSTYGFEEVDEMLDTSIRDLLTGTEEGAEMLRRYDDLAGKGFSGRALQTLQEFGDIAEGKAGAAKAWMAEPANRAALRDAVDAIEGASGLLHATGVPGAAKTLRAATGAARTLLDQYDELAEAVAGKGIRDAATAGAKAVAKSRADRVLSKYGPAIGAGLGGLVGGLPGAVLGGAAGTAAARGAAKGPFAEKALGYARKFAGTRVGKLATDEIAIEAADVVAEQAGRVAGSVIGHAMGAATGIPGGGFLGAIGGGIAARGVGRLGSRYLEEPLKKLGAFAARDRGQTARAMVTPGRRLGLSWNGARRALEAVERDAPIAGMIAGAGWRAFAGETDDTRTAWLTSRDAVLQTDEELVKGVGEQFADMADEYPELFEQAVQHAFATRAFLRGKLPSTNGASLMNPDGIPPERHAIRKWALYYSTAMAPATAIEDLRNGRGRVEQVETLKALYPDEYNELRNGVVMAIAKGARPTVSQRARLSLLFDLGAELDPLFSPSVALAAERARAKRQQQPPAASSVPGAATGKGPAERYASPARTQEAAS